MASQSKAETVKTAVASTSTCTAATAVLLKELLATNPDDDDGASDIPPTAATAPVRPSKAAPRRTRPQASSARPTSYKGNEDELSTKEKAILATHVVNVALKVLSEASKSPPAPAPGAEPSEGAQPRPADRRLQRSSSSPVTPLQPRSLNRVATSPATTRTSKPASSRAASPSTTCLAMVECLRASFACLRSLQDSSKISLPQGQIEAGMSSFVGKIIGLGLHELAFKELTILKGRLETLGQHGARSTKPPQQPTTATGRAKGVAALLNFGNAQFSGSILGLVITTQLQILRLIAASKQPAVIEAVLPCLRTSCSSSPLALLLQFAKESSRNQSKAARQLEQLAQLILSLPPNVSSKDDATAQESRLSCSPECAIELHATGFECRVHWWALAGHQADLEGDLLSPLSRCFAALARRCQTPTKSIYQTCVDAYLRLNSTIEAQFSQPPVTPQSPLTSIHQTLGTLAQKARLYTEAATWISKVKACIQPGRDSDAQCCGVTGKLLAVVAKQDPLPVDQLDRLLQEVLRGLQGSLKGDTAELEELMVHLTVARRSVVGLLINRERRSGNHYDDIPEHVFESCSKFVLQFPRFSVRWIGRAPGRDAEPKRIVRYEQRRQLLLASTTQILDSALVVVKSKIEKDSIPWEELDLVLQDCLSLLEAVGEPNPPTTKSDPASTYHVKVSQLYFMFASVLQRRGEREDGKSVLRAMKRSIEAVRDRSSKEIEKAQLIKKLERFSELCRTSGRLSEAREALKTICTHMVEDGILAAVAGRLNREPPTIAWNADPKTETLSRTLAVMAKLDRSWSDWTFFLADLERAAVLEHLIQIILGDASQNSQSDLPDSATDSLLRLYSTERFPVRRLRVLVQLLTLLVGNARRFREIHNQAETALQACQGKVLGDDAELGRYIPYLRTYMKSLTALVDSESCLQTAELRDVMSSWRALFVQCKSKDDVSALIDNPEQLTRHLESLAQFANLKGEDSLHLSALELSADVSRMLADSSADSTLRSHSALAGHYVSLGCESKAHDVLSRLSELELPDEAESDAAWASFQLSTVEYQLAMQKYNEAESTLSRAKSVYEKQTTRKRPGLQRKLLVARAGLLYTFLALHRGEPHQALVYARNSVRLLYHYWAKLEARAQPSENHQSSQHSSIFEQSTVQSPEASVLQLSDGPDYWALAGALLRSLLRLSAIYVHIGMFQETLYYAEKALQIAEGINSTTHRIQAQSWIGSIWIRAHQPSKGLGFLEQAREAIAARTPTRRAVQLACELSISYGLAKDLASKSQLIESAEAMLRELEPDRDTTLAVEKAVGTKAVTEGIQKLTLKETATRTTRTTRTTRATRTTTATRATTTTRTTRTTRAKEQTVTETAGRSAQSSSSGRTRGKTTKSAATATATAVSAAPGDSATTTLPPPILISKALALLNRKDWTAALALLEESQQVPAGLRQSLEVQVHKGICLIGQSLDRMIHDPVFSVVQDSTVSFPSVSAVASSEKAASDTAATADSPVVRRPRGRAATAAAAAAANRSPKRAAGFAEPLQQALMCLSEAHAMAVVAGDGGLVHRVSALLQHATILLSVASSSSPGLKGTPYVGFATYSMELARNVTWRREVKAIATEQDASSSSSSSSRPNDTTGWPKALTLDEARRPSLGVTHDDVAGFQREYVNVLPPTWSVISVSLSENRHDLCITKFQADHSPFVLRLPLERAISRDADTEVFSFEHGRAELMEIIRLTNESCHDKRDWTVKGAKTAWWQERDALDKRLRQLLENMEEVWLGGFRGIFSQHQRRSDLLARFRKSFQRMLDKNLPSRRQVGGRKATKAPPKITLDSRILDLFIGLGDPRAAAAAAADEEDGDYLDEALNDLLYFVVDVLQFHGERNAYDEIDFDSMVVETQDALHAYHAAAAAESARGGRTTEGAHTILVLDKALHAFPWESLPCMDGLAVSRVPSMACLRRLIRERESESDAEGMDGEGPEGREWLEDGGAAQTHGHTVSRHKGTYILNPGNDLPSTQATFEKPLQTLGRGWTSIVSRAPSEAEFEKTLRESDILLYFGHGSGAQYVRGKTIRRMDKCRATALLMGCSSASLTDAGEFEVHGPVWNYMMAGCPAVVGTLWDVTDKDVDRFAGQMFEEWGLVERGTFPTDKWTEKMRRGGEAAEGMEMDTAEAGVSLVEAVARARDATRFRYITAGAVCVYGIPVYIRRSKE